MLKKLCKRGNNPNYEEEGSGIHVSRIQCLPLPSVSGSAPGNIRWCLRLTLGSLLETTSDPQCGCLFQIWLVPSVLLCQLSIISPGPRNGSFNDLRGLPVPSSHVSRGASWGGGALPPVPPRPPATTDENKSTKT